MKKYETHAAIIAEQLTNIEWSGDELPATIATGALRKLLSRLDAAHKREVENLNSTIQTLSASLQQARGATAEKPSVVGNAAKLREALNKVGNAAAWIAESCNDHQTAKYMNDIIAIVQSALASPARNCDVYKTP